MTPKRALSAEEENLLRHMVKNHCTKQNLITEFRASDSTVRRWLGELGLKTDPKHRMMRRKAAVYIPATDIETAVDRLRARVPVFLESTKKYPNAAPRKYTLDSVFLVNGQRMTGREIMGVA